METIDSNKMIDSKVVASDEAVLKSTAKSRKSVANVPAKEVSLKIMKDHMEADQMLIQDEEKGNSEPMEEPTKYKER